jgi:hypothetical protein
VRAAAAQAGSVATRFHLRATCLAAQVLAPRGNQQERSPTRARKVTQFDETAEKVRHRIPGPFSRQQIGLGRHSQARRTAVWTSRFGVDRLPAGEIEFCSGGLRRSGNSAPPVPDDVRRASQTVGHADLPVAAMRLLAAAPSGALSARGTAR